MLLLDNNFSLISEEEQIKQYSQLVRSCIRPYFLKGGDYDDLYQEGMLGLLSAIRTFDQARNDNFHAYATLCIKRRAIDAVRRDSAYMRRKQHAEEHLANDKESELYVSGDPEVSILANETANEIKASLAGMLSPFEASVLDSYLDGYTSSEIAQRLKRSSKSVDNAIRRIRRKLDSYLSSRR